MNIRLAVFTAYHVLKRYAKNNPDKRVRIAYTDGEGMYQVRDLLPVDAAHALEKLIDHVYPAYDSSRLQLVIRCHECEYYKCRRKKSNHKIKKYVCQIDGKEHGREFFCGHAVERFDA